MNFMREEDEEPERLEDISKEGFGGVLCIETGGRHRDLVVQEEALLQHFSCWKI